MYVKTCTQWTQMYAMYAKYVRKCPTCTQCTHRVYAHVRKCPQKARETCTSCPHVYANVQNVRNVRKVCTQMYAMYAMYAKSIRTCLQCTQRHDFAYISATPKNVKKTHSYILRKVAVDRIIHTTSYEYCIVVPIIGRFQIAGGRESSNSTRRSLSTMEQQNDDQKLREGPCSKQYTLLKQCQSTRGIKRAANALTYCVSETDLLIRCVHRHPRFFHERGNK